MGYQFYWYYNKQSSSSPSPPTLTQVEDAEGGDETEGEDSLDRTANQEILSLLYLIAEDQAKRTGYIHRGVSCNTCGMSPIKGVRYHCSECADVDLCQKCETAKRHNRTHILLKIKVPIPLMKSPRWIRKTFRPAASVANGPDVVKPLSEDLEIRISWKLNMSLKEVEIAYERFMMYADTVIETSDVPYAITCGTLRQVLAPRDPDSLIAERMACMYDQMDDGVVRFESFVDVLDNILYGNHRGAVSRALMAYRMFDLEDNGWISKHNVGRVLNSYYNLLKDIVSDFPEGDVINSKIRNGALTNPRPLSSHFGHEISPGSILPEKDSKLSSSSSIADLTTGKSPPVQSINPQTADRYTRAFGRQGNKDMDDHSRLMLVQWIEAVWRDFGWPDPVEFKPTMFGEHGELIRKYHSDPLCDWLSLCIF